MTIRRVTADDRLTTGFPLAAYAFESSPLGAARIEQFRDYLPYHQGNTTLAIEEDGATLAVVSAIGMRQNLRGVVLPMAGVAGVATHPLARRQGHVRTLLHRLLDEMRDEGRPLSALYPFRPSFYARFGYVGLPKPRTVTFTPADLGSLLRAELPGEVGWERIAAGYPTWRAFTERCLEQRHGFSVFPDYRAVGLRDRDEHWLLTARVDGAVTGAITYRIDDYGGTLLGNELLATDPLARTLLLQFLARHVDQVERVSLQVPPDELPELWLTDLDVRVEARAGRPGSSAPMARLLSLDAGRGRRTAQHLPARSAVPVRRLLSTVCRPCPTGYGPRNAGVVAGGRMGIAGRVGPVGRGGGRLVRARAADAHRVGHGVRRGGAALRGAVRADRGRARPGRDAAHRARCGRRRERVHPRQRGSGPARRP
ncbi:GNAT family N-acetyltransferase [Micromonospora sp. ALFpr18c]|uniref:GNAT family N-acetyltransferase n=1 Tax=unclassified Micromonospora TaxID=2617518 RepID=UPI001CED75EF|nr:GNAT family N-acetyltransferase [Micromonospora sp. ALFpr18c]